MGLGIVPIRSVIKHHRRRLIKAGNIIADWRQFRFFFFFLEDIQIIFDHVLWSSISVAPCASGFRIVPLVLIASQFISNTE